MNFVNAPLQSAMLQQTGLIAPPSLTDEECRNPVIVDQRFEAASNYKKRVKFDLSDGRATDYDVDEAEKFVLGVSIASYLPAIQRNLASVGAAAVENLTILQINAQQAQNSAQFALLNLQLINMNIMHKNSFADRLINPIRPLRQIPQLPQFVQGQPYPGLPASEPLPPNFPATRGDLFKLQDVEINPFLDYYDISYNQDTTIAEKCERLAEYLGLPPSR